MKTRVLLADGRPVVSVDDESAAADAVIATHQQAACDDALRGGRPMPEFKTVTRDDAREAKAKGK